MPELLQDDHDEIHEGGGCGAAFELRHVGEAVDQGQGIVAVEAELPDEDEGDQDLVSGQAVSEEC